MPRRVRQKVDLKAYDRVVEVLLQRPQIDFAEVEKITGVHRETARKIYDGRISRPRDMSFEKLDEPKRCPTCGVLCVEWPCRTCFTSGRSSKV